MGILGSQPWEYHGDIMGISWYKYENNMRILDQKKLGMVQNPYQPVFGIPSGKQSQKTMERSTIL